MSTDLDHVLPKLQWVNRNDAHQILTSTFGTSPEYADTVLILADTYRYHTNIARNLAVVASADNYAVCNVHGSTVNPGIADLIEKIRTRDRCEFCHDRYADQVYKNRPVCKTCNDSGKAAKSERLSA
jgi:hypothetical protein